MLYKQANQYDQQGPNILGFVFGVVQVVLYILYKYRSSKLEQDSTQDESCKDLEPMKDITKENQQLELQTV